VPGHYYPKTPAWFTVLDEPLHLEMYLDAMCTSSLGPEMRKAAVDVVGEFGDGSCVTALGSVLHADQFDDGFRPMPDDSTLDETTRCCAAHALASIGGPEAEERLWSALEHGTFPRFTRRIREAALVGLLDLMTPDGWDNYTFMNPTRARLPADVRARLSQLRDSVPGISQALAMFDEDAS
jgi:hypothetical protein